MKCRILQIVIVEGYEDCERDERESEIEAEEAGAGVGECSVTHQAGCIDHGEFVDELHAVCPRREWVSDSQWGKEEFGKGKRGLREQADGGKLQAHGRETGQGIRTFECCVKKKAPRPNQCIANEADQKNNVMLLLPTVLDANVGVIEKNEIRKRVHSLSDIRSGIVVLWKRPLEGPSR